MHLSLGFQRESIIHKINQPQSPLDIRDTIHTASKIQSRAVVQNQAGPPH
jgi:hypothetical protein